MSCINDRGREIRARIRAEVRGLPARAAPARPLVDPSALVLGRDSGQAPLSISIDARLRHMHAVGTTGGGKAFGVRNLQKLLNSYINIGLQRTQSR